MSEQTYIYAIHDPRDWTIRYVGKSDNPTARLRAHVQKARSMERIRRLMSELEGLGLKLGLSILQTCSRSDWQKWERFWIATVRDSGADLLNIGPGGNGPVKVGARSVETRARISAALKGHGHSSATLAKIRATLKGRTISPEWRAKISTGSKGIPKSPEAITKSGAARKGMKRSPEVRAKMGAARKGRQYGPRSPETRAKISAAHKGKPLSEEHRALISAVQKGRKRGPLSLETREKIRIAATGRKMSPEAIAKMAARHKGKQISAEHRAKISATLKGRVRQPLNLRVPAPSWSSKGRGLDSRKPRTTGEENEER